MRVIGAVVFGAGLFLLVAAAALALFIAPSLTKLPYDLDPSTTIAEAPNASFLEIKPGQVEVKQATLRSTVWIIPDAAETEKLTGALDGNAVVWDAYQEVARTDDDYEVNKYAAQLALNRVSGAAADWDDQWLSDSPAEPEAGNVTFQGQVYKFPFGTEKKTYEIYDRDLRAALPAVFKGTEKIEGLEVYRFEQVIDDQPVRNVGAESMSTILGRFAPEATSGQVVYSNTRTVWVEPTTGMYIKVREQQHKTLVPATGPETELLDATFEYTPDTVEQAADRAASNRTKLLAVGIYGPIGLAVLGLVGLIVGFVVTRRGASAGTHREAGANPDGPPDKSDGVLTDVRPPAVTPASGGPAGVPAKQPPSS